MATVGLAAAGERAHGQSWLRKKVALITTDRDNGATLDPDEFFPRFNTRIDEALGDGAESIVFEITSPGGALVTAYAVADRIEALRNGGTFTVAYVPRHALSAAAMWALACDAVIMGPSARIGDMKPLSMRGTGAFENVPAKLESDVAARVREFARSKGWSTSLQRVCEKMVREDIELMRIRRSGSKDAVFMTRDEFLGLSTSERGKVETHSVVCPKGQVLTMSAHEAAEDFGFPFVIAATDEEMETKVVADGGTLNTYRIRSPGGFSDTISYSFRWILVVIGLVALIIELKQPGVGIFGLISLVSFLAFFLLNSDLNAAPLLAFGIFVAGAFLLFVEILFVPGTFVAGILGTLLIITSTYIATADNHGGRILPDFDNKNDREGFERWILGLTLSFGGGFFLAITFGGLIGRIPFLNRLILRPPSRTKGAEAAEAPAASPAVSQVPSPPVALGDVGTAETDLRPGGTGHFTGNHVSIVTRGDFISRGTRVIVIEIEGPRVVVRRA
jgi:membrane-bound serine protease (ClpP class)